jgi:hypothetical protein
MSFAMQNFPAELNISYIPTVFKNTFAATKKFFLLKIAYYNTEGNSGYPHKKTGKIYREKI